MAYTKTNWTNQDPATPINAANLNKIENGIEEAHTAVDSLQANQPGDWQIVTTDLTVQSTGRYMCDTTGGDITITLPSSPSANDFIFIGDLIGNFSVNNVIVVGNGELIMGSLDNFLLDVDNTVIQLEYINSTYGWRITSRV